MNKGTMGWVVAAVLAVALVGVLAFRGGDGGGRQAALGPVDQLTGGLPRGAAAEAEKILAAKRTEGENALPKLPAGVEPTKLAENPARVCNPNLEPNVSAEWLHAPEDLTKAAGLASRIVVGVVSAVEEGPPFKVEGAKEPDLDTPVQAIKIRVEDSVKGASKPGDILSVQRLGDANGCFRVEGDPPYNVGEKYLLLLREPSEGRNLFQTVSPPTGRFIESNGVLQTTHHIPFITDIRGQKLADVVAKLRGR